MKLRELKKGIVLRNMKIPSAPKVEILDVTSGGVVFLKPLTDKTLQVVEAYDIKDILKLENLEVDEVSSKTKSTTLTN